MGELIANQGANLALADVDHEELKETVRLCSKDGNKVKDYAADVTQELSVEQLFRNIQHDFGGLDGCINNAGVTSDGLLVKVADGKVHSKMLRSRGPRNWRVTKSALRALRRASAIRAWWRPYRRR